MRLGGRRRLASRRIGLLGGALQDYIVVASGTATGRGLATMITQGIWGISGEALGSGVATAHAVRLRDAAGTALGMGAASAAALRVAISSGASLGLGEARGVALRVAILRGASLGIGAGTAHPVVVIAARGASLGIGDARGTARRVRIGRGASLGEGLASLRLELARLAAEDVLTYWTSLRGVLPVRGGRPHFARPTSRPAVDAAGREYSALPGTPVLPWVRAWEPQLGREHRRPALQLRRAETVAGLAVGLDRLYWEGAPGPQAMGVYLRFLVDFDPAGSGHLLWLSNLTGAAPHLRLRYAAGQYRVQVHNGAAAVELALAMGATAGAEAEVLVVVDTAGIAAYAAAGRQAGASASAALPAGGLPVAWSAPYVVLNGYDQAPTDARYLEVKTVRAGGFVRAGAGRLVEARNLALSPAGE